MKLDDSCKPIINLTLVLLLFYCSNLFVLIPINLFNIDVNNCGNLIYSLLVFFPNIVLATFLFFFYRKDLKDEFKVFKSKIGEFTDIGFKNWLLGYILMIISNFLILSFSPLKTPENEQSVRTLISMSPFISFIFAVFVGPFVEEMIFRKSFKDAIKSKWLFILVSGIVFGSLHVIDSITSLYELLYIIPYSCLGIAFSKTHYDTNNIFSSILIHIFHNFTSIIMVFLSSGGI